jgi:hypothetical protein
MATTIAAPPLRHHTVFEAISDLASYQYQTLQQISDLSDSELNIANAVSGTTGIQALLNGLVKSGTLPADSPLGGFFAAVQTIATALSSPPVAGSALSDLACALKKIADKPNEVQVAGRICTEVEQQVSLAETRRLFPGPLLALLNLLHRIELRLADIGIAEQRPDREKAVTAYHSATREFEEQVAANRHLKGLKPQLRGLALKLTDERKEAIDAEMLEKLSILHAISASAVALQAAHTPQHG